MKESAMAAKGFISLQISAQGRVYDYVLYVPSGVDLGSPVPLVVFLHGRGECGTDGLKPLAVGLPPAVMLSASRWPALMLVPQKPGSDDLWVDHDAALLAMIDRVKREYIVDEDRVYLTGLSQGGRGTWEFGARHPELFAALAPVCGFGEPSTIAPGVKGLPVWAFHGLKDDVVPPSKSEAIVDAVKAAGGQVQLTLFPEANHNSWDAAYRESELAEWLFRQRRSR